MMIVSSRQFQHNADMLKRLGLKNSIDDGEDVLTRIDKVGAQFRSKHMDFAEMADGLLLSKDL